MSQALKVDLSDTGTVYDHICKRITDITGNQLGPKQRPMVESRLRKRMSELGLATESEYETYFFKNEKVEIEQLTSILTTHHTYFFRELSHFQYLESTILPDLIEKIKNRADKKLRVWSAACSTGQEVYTLAMFLGHYLKKFPGISYEILGTDIDPKSVEHARNGVYLFSEIKEIPLHFLSGNWARGTGDIQEYAKVKDPLKNNCRFEVRNLIALGQPAPSEKYDIIFCRNVFIYFTPIQIQEICRNLVKRLEDYGTFFIGLSESVNALDCGLKMVSPAVYRRPSALGSLSATSKTAATKEVTQPAPNKNVQAIETPKILKVGCVDDSGTIITMLKKILTKDKGFEIIWTAENGLDAAKKLAETKVDLMTLDIHMPEMTGIEYLKKYMNPSHPVVVMVSSVSRENSDLAIQALELGASDYIEKPALSNLNAKAEELYNKLSLAYMFKTSPAPVDRTFAKVIKIEKPESKLVIASFGYGDKNRIGAFAKELFMQHKITLIGIVEGMDSVVGDLLDSFGRGLSGRHCTTMSNHVPHKHSDFIIAEIENDKDKINSLISGRTVAYCIFANSGTKSIEWIKANRSSSTVYGEDLRGLGSKASWRTWVKDSFPSTSFAYMVTEDLSKK